MDINAGLITRLIDTGQYNYVQREGITSDFLDQDSASIFSYVQRYYAQHKEVPTRDIIIQAYPSFTFHQGEEPLQYFIDEIKETWRRNKLEDDLSKVAKIYQTDTKGAELLLRSTLSSLSITSKSFQDLDLAASVEERLEAYQYKKENPGATGILSRWQSMDYQTLGWQPEEFAVLVGPKYIGKSWIMVYLAVQAALQGEKVVMATSEMSQEELGRRIDAIYASVPFEKLRRGELTATQEQQYRTKMKKMMESNFKLIIAREGVSTIDDIGVKAVEHDATMLFADSVYLFPPSLNYKFQGEVPKRMEISQKCKRIAKDLQIPFLVSVQAGRKKKAKDAPPDLDDIEWSNAFSQDANTVFFIQKDEIDIELHRSQVWLLKARDASVDNFFINQDFQKMDFSERKDDATPRTDVFEDNESYLFDE